MSLYTIVDHPVMLKTAIASTFIPANTDILFFGNGPEDKILESPNMHSVQLDFNRHLDSFTDARFAPHSSNPNSRLVALYDIEKVVECPADGDVSKVVGYSIRSMMDIPAGTEISWNYNSSELVVTCSFTDLYTEQSITGFTNLSSTQQRELLPLATPFIRQDYMRRFKSQITTVAQPIVGEVLVAAKDLPSGTIVGAYGDNDGDEVVTEPTMHSVQVNATRHVHTLTLARYASHSFQPSCRLVPYTTLTNGTRKELTESDVTSFLQRNVEVPVEGFWLRTTRAVTAGESLSFDYATSEWDMACGFDDLESNMPCRGFKYLPAANQVALLATATPYIQQQFVKWQREMHMAGKNCCMHIHGSGHDHAHHTPAHNANNAHASPAFTASTTFSASNSNSLVQN